MNSKKTEFITLNDKYKTHASLRIWRFHPSMRYDFYLCGGSEMIREVTRVVDERFAESFVYREVYY